MKLFPLKNKYLVIAAFAVLALALAFLLGTSSSSTFVLLLGALVFLVLCVFVFREPFVGLALVFFFLPFERIGAVQAAGVTIRASQIISLVMIAAWLAHSLVRGKFALRKNPLVLPLSAFLVANVVSLLNVVHFPRAISVLSFTAFVFIVSFVTSQLITEKRQVRMLVNILVGISIAVSLFGIFQFIGDLVGLPSSITGLDIIYQKQVFGFPRIQATSLEPLYFADFLMLPLGLVLARMFTEERKHHTWWWVLLTTLFLINFVLTVSRGAYFGGIGMLGILVLYNVRRVFSKRNITIYLSILGFAFVVVVALMGLSSNARKTLQNFQSHVTDITSGASFAERQGTITDALDAWKAHPIIGIGPGNFGTVVAENPLLTPAKGWLIVNNETVEILTETGIVGLVLFAWAVWRLLAYLFQAIRRMEDPYLRTILIGTFAALVGILIQYQTFSTLYIMNIWVYVGFALGVANLAPSRPTSALPRPTK